MAKIIPYNTKLKQLARNLRKNMTYSEVLLWNELKLDKFWGFDFDRQRCIDNYIVDFYCKELMLAIEIDGRYHESDDVFANDEVRQKRLESLGVRFIRFTESEVQRDMINVIRALEGEILVIIKSNPSFKLPVTFDRGLLSIL